MAVKGFYDNPQEATVPANSDLLGIQTGTTLADMKKITYENLVKPLDTAKADKDTDAVVGHIAVFDADGNPVDGVNVPSDFEIISRKKTTWSTPTSDLNYSSEKLVKASLDAQEVRIAENESDIATNISDIGDLELAVAGIDEDIIALDGRLDTLEGADTVEGSVLKDIKDNAEDATYDNTDSGLTASTLKTAIDEVEGRVDTAEGEIDDLQTAETEMKGTGWNGENLVDHESRLDTLEADDTTEGSVLKAVKDAVDPIDTRLTGLDTLTYEGTTYMVSRKIENGHLVTVYTEVA